MHTFFFIPGGGGSGRCILSFLDFKGSMIFFSLFHGTQVNSKIIAFVTKIVNLALVLILQVSWWCWMPAQKESYIEISFLNM